MKVENNVIEPIASAAPSLPISNLIYIYTTNWDMKYQLSLQIKESKLLSEPTIVE